MLYPSDEFGGQELPQDQIAAFVAAQGLPTTPGSGVTLMAKTKVNGEKADPVWKALKANFPGDITWNFAGIFLVDKTGTPVGRWNAKGLAAIDESIKFLLA